MQFEFCGTNDQLVDIFTTALPREKLLGAQAEVRSSTKTHYGENERKKNNKKIIKFNC